jgi:hypothetical protein
MKTLWRCYNPKCTDRPNGPLGHDFTFEGDEKDVACDKCTASLKHEPQISRYLAKLTVVHFEPDHPQFEEVSCGELACTPGVPATAQRSREIMAVNCTACQASAAYKAVQAKRGAVNVIPEGDFLIAGATEDGPKLQKPPKLAGN